MSKKKDRKKVGKVLDLDSIDQEKSLNQRNVKFAKKVAKAIDKKFNGDLAILLTPNQQNDDYPGFDQLGLEAKINIINTRRVRELHKILALVGKKLNLKSM